MTGQHAMGADGCAVRIGPTCTATGKVSYYTRAEAKLVRRRRRLSAHLRAFSCPHCGLFHLGNVPPEAMRGVGRAQQSRRDGAGARR
jgi:hypothetical protein